MNAMFSGYVELDQTLYGVLLVVDSSQTPIAADALPTFRVYGPDGFIVDGTCTNKDTGAVENATDSTPITITSTDHGLTTGTYVIVSDVLGNTAANGSFVVTRVNANQFSLDDSAGNGAYTSGGNWKVAGLYSYTVAALGVNGFDSGEKYDIQFTYEVSATPTSQLHTFQVA